MKKAQILKVFISMVLALAMMCGTNIPVFATEADDELVVTSSYNPFATTANNKTYYIGVRFYSASTSGTFTLNISEQTLPDPPIILSEPEIPDKMSE